VSGDLLLVAIVTVDRPTDKSAETQASAADHHEQVRR